MTNLTQDSKGNSMKAFIEAFVNTYADLDNDLTYYIVKRAEWGGETRKMYDRIVTKYTNQLDALEQVLERMYESNTTQHKELAKTIQDDIAELLREQN